MRDLFNNIFNSPVTLADIGISEQRKELAMQAIAQVWTTGICSLSVAQTPDVIKLRQQGEEQQALERARERVERAVKDLKNKIASENEEVRQIYKQITPTFDPEDDGIWSEIDLLEGDPVHRGVAMRNPRLKPFWLKAEGGEWQGLWEKGVFKKWKRSDLLPNDRVFTSRYVYKIKRSAKTGEAYRFKARMIVRGFEMEKGVDYVDNFSPTPGLAVARLMMSLAVANDMELHKIDSSKLSYKLISSTKALTAGTSLTLLLEVPRQATRISSMRSYGRSMVVHRHQELCTKPWTRISNLKGSIPLVSRSPCGYDLQAANIRRTSMCQLTSTTAC